jgi:radical SAM protein with 4Fe4S-binding SPASM domain
MLEVLTVDNHADGPYLFLQLLKQDRERAFEALELLSLNGGNQSGAGIGAIDEEGNVHPDQFLREITLGNVRERRFSEIWTGQNGILEWFRSKGLHVKGRCSLCSFLEVCNGNFRARALAVFSDLWQEDPQCYLTEEEIRSLKRDPEG